MDLTRGKHTGTASSKEDVEKLLGIIKFKIFRFSFNFLLFVQDSK